MLFCFLAMDVYLHHTTIEIQHMFSLHVRLQKSVFYYKYNRIYNAKIPMNRKHITTDIQNQLYELRLCKNVVGYTNSNLFYEMQWVCIMYSISQPRRRKNLASFMWGFCKLLTKKDNQVLCSLLLASCQSTQYC